MNKTDLLRNLPSVDELLRSELVADLRESLPHPQLTQWIREGIENCRQKILGDESLAENSITEFILSRVRQRKEADSGQSIQRVINATGVVLHTNLGRAPLPQRAIEHMNEATKYSNVEFDLASGRRSKRGGRVTQLLSQLTGAEDALIVNNCAAATMLVLQAVAFGKEVVVSRGQLVEIGGGFRLPDVFRAAGVTLHEVGTTNRTYLRDYEQAINEQTAALIRVHRSNFHLSGFVTEPTIEELVSAKRPPEVAVIDDLGSGCISDLSHLGLNEPTVGESVRSGADLTLFSGDKLFGGPQAGMIVGRKTWIERLRKSPMMRAMRADKTTLAALEATAEIHLSGNGSKEIPVLRMLSAEVSEIQTRCQSLQESITSLCYCEVVPSESQVGGGSIPGSILPSFAVKIHGQHVDGLARRLRECSPAIQARVSEECLWLDLRTVAEDEFQSLASSLVQALTDWTQDKASKA